jgi:arylsulfatase A-like enzyme
MLTRSDYTCGHFGKWHLGDEIFPQHGFSEWRSIEDMYARHYSAGRDRSARSDYHHFLLEHGYQPGRGDIFGRGETARFPEAVSKPAFLAREASQFIRAHAGDPFILYVNFLEPHMPFFGPRDGQYDPSAIDLPENFDAVLSEDQHLKARLLARHYYEHGHSGLPLKSEADWRRLIANYWGLCSLVDTHVGTILATLEQCGLADNTIVVYTSDHGDMMGSHRLVAKCVMFEEAVRVPMAIRLPGQARGRRISGPVSQTDVVPTLLDLLGQDIPGHLQGGSLRPLLEDDTRNHADQDVFIEWNGPNNGLRDAVGRADIPEWMTAMAPRTEIEASMTDPVQSVVTPDGWKLNASPCGYDELYNLNDDPGETRNLVARDEYASLAGELRQRIAAWRWTVRMCGCG